MNCSSLRRQSAARPARGFLASSPTISLQPSKLGHRSSLPEAATWEYFAPAALDGVLTDLSRRLREVLVFDGLQLRERGLAGRAVALRIREAGRIILHLRLVRRGGKVLVSLAGVEPGKALAVIGVCRDHFDRWFGTAPVSASSSAQTQDPIPQA
ncbi:MAG TPA: hypothetical protein VNC50_18245 [Planctomycetia bacterium]|nr:hypothetical protein [Planctomycetia bacterium]